MHLSLSSPDPAQHYDGNSSAIANGDLTKIEDNPFGYNTTLKWKMYFEFIRVTTKANTVVVRLYVSWNLKVINDFRKKI